MTTEDRIIIRALYNTACHADGDATRWQARDRLEAMLVDEAGLDLGRVFEAMGLDVGAYRASEPISR